MLYDPKWEQKTETKADPFTLDSFIAWLEKQPAKKTYCYTSTGHCLIAQYLKHLGHTNISVAGYGKWWSDQGRGQLAAIADIANPPSSALSTFGAALERARAI